MITRLFDFFFFFLSITENIKIGKKNGGTRNQRQYSKRCFEFVEEKNWDNSNSLGLLEIREKLVSPILIVCFNSLSLPSHLPAKNRAMKINETVFPSFSLFYLAQHAKQSLKRTTIENDILVRSLYQGEKDSKYLNNRTGGARTTLSGNSCYLFHVWIHCTSHLISSLLREKETCESIESNASNKVRNFQFVKPIPEKGFRSRISSLSRNFSLK